MTRPAILWSLLAACFGLFLGLVRAPAADDAPHHSTLRLESRPAADVFINGRPSGRTPCYLDLLEGRYEVRLEAEGFASHATNVLLLKEGVCGVNVDLLPRNPDADGGFQDIARAAGIEAPDRCDLEVSRGGLSASQQTPLWPRGEVQIGGQTQYAIEVDGDYEPCFDLVWQRGDEELHRELFDPEMMLTVAPIPAEVLETLQVGDAFSWGLVPHEGAAGTVSLVEAHVTDRTDVRRSLRRLMRSPIVQCQSRTVGALLVAETLSNSGLHAEAAAVAVEVTRAHPGCLRAYDVALRELDLLECGRTHLATSLLGVLLDAKRRGAWDLTASWSARPESDGGRNELDCCPHTGHRVPREMGKTR